MTNPYIETFFREKEIPFVIFQIEHKGQVHFVKNTYIIELIKELPYSETKLIEVALRRLDFTNQDINHYLEHLARGYVETNF